MAIHRRDRHRTESVRKQLEDLQKQYDNQYLDMQDQDSRDAHQAIPAEGLRFFYRASALSAVLRALDNTNDAEAATDIVYETIASSSDESTIVATLLMVLE